MAKQSWTTRAKTRNTKAINKAKKGIIEWLITAPFYILFFPITTINRAFFKKDIEPGWKVFHKIFTACLFAFFAYTITIAGIKEGEENVTYLLIAIFAGLSLFSIISIFKKKS